MDTTQIFMLDNLLKVLPMTVLDRARTKLSEDLKDRAVEITDLVEKGQDFGLETLLTERAILKDYISRIAIQQNLLTLKEQDNEVITVR
jgi:hypothetical protein